MRQILHRHGCQHFNLGPCELSHLEVRRPMMLWSDSTESHPLTLPFGKIFAGVWWVYCLILILYHQGHGDTNLFLHRPWWCRCQAAAWLAPRSTNPSIRTTYQSTRLGITGTKRPPVPSNWAIIRSGKSHCAVNDDVFSDFLAWWSKIFVGGYPTIFRYWSRSGTIGTATRPDWRGKDKILEGAKTWPGF